MLVNCTTRFVCYDGVEATYDGDPVAQVRGVFKVVDEVRGDAEDDEGGGEVECVVRGQQRAVQAIRADGGSAVVSCGLGVCVGATSESHVCFSLYSIGVLAFAVRRRWWVVAQGNLEMVIYGLDSEGFLPL